MGDEVGKVSLRFSYRKKTLLCDVPRGSEQEFLTVQTPQSGLFKMFPSLSPLQNWENCYLMKKKVCFKRNYLTWVN